MDTEDELRVPSPAQEEAGAPQVGTRVADAIGALAAADGLKSPLRFEMAISVAEAAGDILGEPALTKLSVLRALASPLPPVAALAALKSSATLLSGPDRVAMMGEMVRLVGVDVKSAVAGLAPKLADALNVPLPARFRSDSGGLMDDLRSFAGRAVKMVRSESPLMAAARDFVFDFDEAQSFSGAVVEAQHAGNRLALISAIPSILARVREGIEKVARATEVQANSLSVAQELEAAADKIEKAARQRWASISRRAIMMKRHIREDLNAIVEDAAEEFEADYRRLAANKKGWFGSLDTSELNERLVVKNLERRYRNLSRRYQDQLDLFDREVAEFCDEFTRAADEALRPMARHEFRTIVPLPTLELRVKNAVDRATTRTLITGAAGAVASGAAVQMGLLTAGAIVGAATTPVGIAILGAVAVAGIWKSFAAPGQRKKRDLSERARTLEDSLRDELMTNLPRFEAAVEAVVDRFRAAAVPDIARPRNDATWIREIASAHRTIAGEVIKAANDRVGRLETLLLTPA